MLRRMKQRKRTTLAEYLFSIRSDRGLTQAQLAQRAGINQSTVQRIEQKGAKPSVFTALALARALEIPIEEFCSFSP
jgi:transcriptional regulator with XRE-family HTH domain